MGGKAVPGARCDVLHQGIGEAIAVEIGEVEVSVGVDRDGIPVAGVDLVRDGPLLASLQGDLRRRDLLDAIGLGGGFDKRTKRGGGFFFSGAGVVSGHDVVQVPGLARAVPVFFDQAGELRRAVACGDVGIDAQHEVGTAVAIEIVHLDALRGVDQPEIGARIGGFFQHDQCAFIAPDETRPAALHQADAEQGMFQRRLPIHHVQQAIAVHVGQEGSAGGDRDPGRQAANQVAGGVEHGAAGCGAPLRGEQRPVRSRARHEQVVAAIAVVVQQVPGLVEVRRADAAREAPRALRHAVEAQLPAGVEFAEAHIEIERFAPAAGGLEPHHIGQAIAVHVAQAQVDQVVEAGGGDRVGTGKTVQRRRPGETRGRQAHGHAAVAALGERGQGARAGAGSGSGVAEGIEARLLVAGGIAHGGDRGQIAGLPHHTAADRATRELGGGPGGVVELHSGVGRPVAAALAAQLLLAGVLDGGDDRFARIGRAAGVGGVAVIDVVAGGIQEPGLPPAQGLGGMAEGGAVDVAIRARGRGGPVVAVAVEAGRAILALDREEGRPVGGRGAWHIGADALERLALGAQIACRKPRNGGTGRRTGSCGDQALAVQAEAVIGAEIHGRRRNDGVPGLARGAAARDGRQAGNRPAPPYRTVAALARIAQCDLRRDAGGAGHGEDRDRIGGRTRFIHPELAGCRANLIGDRILGLCRASHAGQQNRCQNPPNHASDLRHKSAPDDVGRICLKRSGLRYRKSLIFR